MTFHFRLQSVLNVRLSERDLQRQTVAMARARHGKRIEEKNVLTDDRAAVLGELRSINDGEAWAVGSVVSRQRHAEQLASAMVIADAALVEAESHLSICLKRLIVADQSVRALERLVERQLAEFQRRRLNCEAREFDDTAKSFMTVSRMENLQ